MELNAVLARVQQHVQALKGRLAQLQPIIHAVLEGTQVHLPAMKDVRVGRFLKFGHDSLKRGMLRRPNLVLCSVQVTSAGLNLGEASLHELAKSSGL